MLSTNSIRCLSPARPVCAGDVPRDGALPAQRHRAPVRGRLSVRGQARLLQPHTQGARQVCRVHEEVKSSRNICTDVRSVA